MNENEPQLPEDIRKALKKSPTFTPPESFYRGVLEKIERKRTAVPWFFGYPMKGLATACVLVMIVLVTRETRETRPKLFQHNLDVSNERPISMPEAVPSGQGIAVDVTPTKGGAQSKDEGLVPGFRRDDSANKSRPATSLKGLASSKEVQDRLNRPISNLVENPSPFEEEDATLRKQLGAETAMPAPALESPANAPASRSRASFGYVAQARDTVSGSATQGSFLYGQDKLAEKQNPLPANAGIDRKKQGRPYWKGGVSGIATFRTVVIRTPEQWQALWREHAVVIVPPPPAPDVDFGNTMVVGIFDGTKPNGGYAIDIVDIQVLSDQVVVLYRESRPPAGMGTVAVLTQPFHLRVIPKTNLPVAFQKEL